MRVTTAHVAPKTKSAQAALDRREAAQAGAAIAFEGGRDICVPYYRELGPALGIGPTPYEVRDAMKRARRAAVRL